jgi:RNase P subunit RPR2
MIKSIICPNCNISIAIGVNCHHDPVDFSLICDKCTKPILPTTDAKEMQMTKQISTSKGRNYVNDYSDTDDITRMYC